MAFMNFAPQFGQSPDGNDLERLKKSVNYNLEEEVFENLIETSLDMNFSKLRETLGEFLFSKNTKPPAPLPSEFENLNARDSTISITWFGHSAVLLEIDGYRLLLDPMLGPAASPVSFFTKRFSYENSIPLEEITDIDAILISHDHYDHLDYPSILKLKKVTKKFFVPLGVGGHLKRWGVEESAIEELDWWTETSLDSLKLVFTPARHFSGRGFSDRNSTLWGSWVIKSRSNSIYFSGDSGYGPHFNVIGEKYGPFDLAMMECGQYNVKWEAIHLMPEQTIQAGIDIQAKQLIPIHWGAFQLAVHTWDDPVLRASQIAREKGIQLTTPTIGRRIQLENNTEPWWEMVK